MDRLRYDLLIGGSSTGGAAGTEIFDRAPATGELLAEVAEPGPCDVEEAVDVAVRTHRDGAWARRSASDRGRVIAQAARLLDERSEEFARTEARDVGKPIVAARAEVAAAVAALEYYAGAASKWFGEVIPVDGGGLDIALREPVGVTALITPWNFPLLLATWKVAPALACGNPVLLKPSPLAPLTTIMLGELLCEAGVPGGCVSVLAGSDEIGARLVRDPRVSKISFTGSTAAGKDVARAAAENLTRVSLELGGKSPCIVFDDVDVDRCAASTIDAVFDNAGQDCCARSRILIESAIFDEFAASFAKRAGEIVLGDPLSETTEMGSLISREQRDRVQRYVDESVASGAELLTGGSLPEAAELQSGSYFQPTVLVNVDPASRVAQEEIFGPVVVLVPFTDEAEAVSLANGVSYGLSGSIWTKDLSRALRMTRQIEAGVLSINSHRSVFVEAPFGGVKASGIGRELGMAAMALYTETKNLFFAVEEGPQPDEVKRD